MSGGNKVSCSDWSGLLIKSWIQIHFCTFWFIYWAVDAAMTNPSTTVGGVSLCFNLVNSHALWPPCLSSLLDGKAIFHRGGTALAVGFVSSLQPSICYLPALRSSSRPVLQQRNEPSLTSIPGAIIYSIKFVVSSLVIVMNTQGVNFFVSQSHTKGDGGGWQSAQVDWIPCCRRAKRWRLMMQARTKVFWMRRETGTQCVTWQGVTKNHAAGRLPRKTPWKCSLDGHNGPLHFIVFVIRRTASSQFESWLFQEKRKNLLLSTQQMKLWN